MTSNWNYLIRYFYKKRIFTNNDINMNRQIDVCDIITAYEYDKLYFMVHKAFPYYFTNESKKKIQV